MRMLIALVMGTAVGVSCAEQALDRSQYEPADPFAAVDRDPVRIGELNLILGRRLGPDKIELATDPLRQATALLLVRRRLAMQALRQRGGAALEALIERSIEQTRDELRRRGSSLAAHAAARHSDETSYLHDLSWQIAWSRYVQSKLTDENLQRYFERHADRYGVSSFEDLTDQSELRRQAVSDLFTTLVRQAQPAEVQWLIPALRPPAGILLIPEP